MLRNSLAILAVALSLQACFKGDATTGTCAADAECGTGSTCNTSLHVCQYACPQLCGAGQLCVSGQCVAADCIPSCDTNHTCDKNQTPPKCIELTQGTAKVVKPAQGDVVGGPQMSVKATAGAPGTGPAKVVFRIEQGGAIKATLDVLTGTAGDYSGTLVLTGHGLVTGAGKVFATTYYTVNGTEMHIDSPAIDVTVDEDAPAGDTSKVVLDETDWSNPRLSTFSPAIDVTVDEDAPVINTPTTDPFYSSTAVTPAPNALVTVQIADIGAAGVDKTTPRLHLGTHNYPAAQAPATPAGNGTYSFTVPTGDVGITANNQGAVGYSVTASDIVGNATALPSRRTKSGPQKNRPSRQK